MAAQRGGCAGAGAAPGAWRESDATATARPLLQQMSPPVATFSPIACAPTRVGEDQPPPSWDPVPSPRVNMLGRGSPKLTILLSKAAQKKNSPKGPTKKHGGSLVEKSRASWNPLEKILAELLHEHNTPEYRGQNGWTSEAWNKIVKEFYEKDRYACFTKAQIQEKEKDLKREYRMLKEAKKQSGASWNNQI